MKTHQIILLVLGVLLVYVVIAIVFKKQHEIDDTVIEVQGTIEDKDTGELKRTVVYINPITKKQVVNFRNRPRVKGIIVVPKDSKKALLKVTDMKILKSLKKKFGSKNKSFYVDNKGIFYARGIEMTTEEDCKGIWLSSTSSGVNGNCHTPLNLPNTQVV